MNSIVFEDKKVVPSKVVCIGRNYVEHIKELNNEIPSSMVIFNKPNSSISDKLFFIDKNTRYEAELSFLVEQNQIVGVGIGIDLTKADLQNYLKQKGLPWERAKAFNNSAIFSNFISIKDIDIKDLSFKLYINNNLIQHGTYQLMIYKPNQILKEILSFMNLEDYDIIMSGTPKGVGYYKKDDKFDYELYLKDRVILDGSFIVK